MDDWNLQNHIPQIIVIPDPLHNPNQTNNKTLVQINITNTNNNNQSHDIFINNTTISNTIHLLNNTDEIDIDNFSKLFTTPHHIINGNPFQFKQCRNAILNKENIEIKDFIWEHTQHLDISQQEQIRKHVNDIIWSRELIDALNKSLPYGHLIRIRLSYDANNPKWQGSRARHRNEALDGFTMKSRMNRGINRKLLVYYHISKCGSSSIHNMLRIHYNTTRMYWRELLDLDAFEVLPDIECAFTFIRHPIDRIISGYYTILSMLNREFEHKSNGNITKRIQIQQNYGALHPWFIYNISAKIRFKMFVKEVIKSGYQYISTDHLILHVASQIGSSIGNFHLWPIHFMGRMEYFEEHWYQLTMEHDKCSKVFDSINNDDTIHGYKLAHAMKRIGHQNSIESNDVDGDQEKKNKYKKNGLSAEHFVFIEDKELYQQTVDYYYQDFVCFGYNMSHQGYIKHLDDKYYI